MRRRNNLSLPLLSLLVFSLTLFQLNLEAQGGAANQPPAASGPVTPQDGAANPAAGTGQNSTQKSTSNSTSNATQNEDSGDSGVFVFHKDVEEVVLHATVIDDKQRIVTTLDKGAFNVYEDGHPQVITSFRHEDIPVAMGIVVDNSGSMREKRQKVNAAALNLVRASNPNDEVFIVNFND
jgi:Mg-chelatase subunit ChlD